MQFNSFPLDVFVDNVPLEVWGRTRFAPGVYLFSSVSSLRSGDKTIVLNLPHLLPTNHDRSGEPCTWYRPIGLLKSTRWAWLTHQLALLLAADFLSLFARSVSSHVLVGCLSADKAKPHPRAFSSFGLGVETDPNVETAVSWKSREISDSHFQLRFSQVTSREP